MAQVARPDRAAAEIEDETAVTWSPRAKALILAFGALAAWAVLGGIAYLIVAAF